MTIIKKELYKPLPLFPSRLSGKTAKVDEANQEILETFRKVEINIHLLDAIKQVPRYAKFLKELCTAKRKLKGNENVTMGENVLLFSKRSFPLNVRTQMYSLFLVKLETSPLIELCLI